MDLITSCKDKLAYFRIKELKDVLTQLGLSKQGRKQDLVDRILAALSEEQVSKMWAKKNVGKEDVAKLVDDIYRKMQVSGATDLASNGQGASDCSNIKIKGEFDDPYRSGTKVRCPCGSSLETETMIKCEDVRCNVWQHLSCVREKPGDSDSFYCELCRLSRADPFWVSEAHPLLPVKMTTTNIPPDGTNPLQSVERTFQLSRAEKDLLSKQEYDVQAWCMLLNDKVPFRMHWPQYADLQVNGMPVRAINRPGSQLLGANGRDDGPIITPCMKDGINKIGLTGGDARPFCLGVRLVKRRNVQQILNLIPKESDGERFEEALARVCRCVGGGGATEADSDSDLEVVADSFAVNLRCPMSGSRMKVAGRFKHCVHMGCFDLEVFVELNQRSRKWQCPICLRNYSLENIIIDPYFNRVTSLMRYCGEDVTEIEVKPDGSWRVKTKTESERRELGNLTQWHLPDSTLCLSAEENTTPPHAEYMKQIKQEGVSDGHTGLKLGIRKNRDGFWEVSKPDELNNSSSNRLHDKFGDPELKVIPMSSSATGSGRDGEDASVNQEGGGNFDFCVHNGIELDSITLNVDPSFGYVDQIPSAPVGDAEVIVLSDSDEENDILVSPRNFYKNDQSEPSAINFSIPHPGITDSFEDPALGTGACLGLFNNNNDDFENMHLWQLPSGAQGGAFQLFGSDGDVPDALGDLQHGSMNCTPSTNGYNLSSVTVAESSALVPDPSVGHADDSLNDNLVDNPLAIGRDDPSLQIFLPTRPSAASLQPNIRDQSDMSNALSAEDWISLRLGDGATGGHCEPPTANGFTPGQQIPSGEGSMETLADTASLLLGMNDGRSEKTTRRRSGSPFSFPRQKRSVRPRMYLSIDSDSE